MRKVKLNRNWVGYPVVQHSINEHIELLTEMIFAEIDGEGYNLICTGTSGLYIATLMKARDPKRFDITYVGKEEETAHRGRIIDSMNYNNPSIWVDDFMASGETMMRVFDEMYEYIAKRRRIEEDRLIPEDYRIENVVLLAYPAENREEMLELHKVKTIIA